jgi:CRISPR-associated protein (Cas_CXXC_CXXC)
MTATILPTGNPFVDTGLYAMRARASDLRDGEPVDSLTPQLVEEVLGDGIWLAQANRHLNSFFMVCTNSALVNSSTNKWMYETKQRGHLDDRDEGWKAYIQTLINLRDELLTLSSDAVPDCESCGDRPATRVLDRIGRDYFPLAGSLGNDAQALPAASRSPRVCALCLLAIQWLPLGAIMFNGSLACFQFTDPLLSFYFARDTYRETRNRLEMARTEDKVLVPGSREGATPAAILLLERMRQLQQDRVMLNLPPYVSLNIWAFSNSGANPDCNITEIENPALQFLWKAAGIHYTEVQNLLKREDPKKPNMHLLTAIEGQRDYAGFYPQKARKGATDQQLTSKSLYELYQTHVLARPLAALRVAEWLASQIHIRLHSGDKNEMKILAAVLKESPRWTKDKTMRVSLRRYFASLAEKGGFTLDEYARLFPAANLTEASVVASEHAKQIWREPGNAIRISSEGWDVFWFYLHHANQSTTTSHLEEAHSKADGDLVMFTNPKIRTFAHDVFNYFLERQGGKDKSRGLRYIKRYIVDGFSRSKITIGDLRSWFCKLAETQSEYNCEDWDALCRDEQGREATGELRFQFRLEIANLYREARHITEK